MLQQDLLGIHRGYCRRPECSGCEGFSRRGKCFQIAPADIGFRCASCGCTSKEHEQLPHAPSVGLAPEDSQAGYHAHRHLCVGDLVQLKAAEASTAKRGIVLDILESGPFGLCSVALLRESGRPVPKETFISLRAAELQIEDHASVGSWSPPRVLGGFDREENFKNLVFQPGGLHSLVPALKRRRCSICVLGGSISLQARGYRPHLVRALERRGVAVEDLPAAVGTAGSRPLSLVVHDMVLTKRPDLLIVEVAVNDGDDLLESTPNSNAVSILQAAEGIVRSVRRGSPSTTIVFLEMFLRDDMEARKLKTGSEAWQHSSVEEAIVWYHDVAPRLHRHVCSHYGLAQIDLIPALRSLGAEQRSEWFRDDCHHSDAGGEALGNLLAKLLLWAVRQPALTALKVPAIPSIPAALDAGCWCNGKTIRVLRGWLSPASLVSTRRDKDLLHLGQQADWLLLHTAGKATIPFKGSSCGLMTLLGPDAPCLQVRVDGGDVRRLSLLDQWCFYWRDAVVLLCDGLVDTTHTLELQVEEEMPDMSILKRQPCSELWDRFQAEAREAGRQPQKLWMLYACAVETEA
ncbi:unnamed protein product [Symbiodinium sp. CCMP2592]|nr:unnamed protein product [Symbiodinium sp. CCMP2592]